jgi:integrase
MEVYRRKDGLISRTIKFFFHGHCYRRPLGPVSLKAYKLAERQARVEAANGTFYKPAAPRGIPTLAAFAPVFLDACRTDARPGTVITYASRIDNHLHPLLGHLRMDQITPAVLDQYRVIRRREGAAIRSVNADLAIVSAMLRRAALWLELPALAQVKVQKLRTEERNLRVLTDAEVDRLLFSATQRLRPLIQFGLQTGLRRGELLSLTWGDIDWKKAEVTVIGTLAKSRRRRAVPLNRAALAVLRELQGKPVRHGRIFGYKSIRSAFSRAVQKAGLTGVSPHTLRHTFATRYLERGGAVHMLQAFLGHADLTTTSRYLHATSEYGRQSIELLGEPDRHQRESPSA